MALTDKKAPVWALVLTDALMIGIGLLTFALFHHVLPQKYDVVVSPSDFNHTALVIDDGAENDILPPFTEDIVFGETSYSSPNVAIEVSTVNGDNCIYHIADIHVKNLSSLRTAFAQDTYGRSISEKTPDMAKRHNAICAINGDYYGASNHHVAIRNGVCYGCNPKSDICVLYGDGTMCTYPMAGFDADAVMAQGAWQAWSFGPALLRGGKAVEDFDSEIAGNHPRSVIGYFEPGHYCFIAVDGRSKRSRGLTLAKLSALCESLGLEEAYNLDGGQTSMLVFGDEIINNPYNGGRKCSDIIYICEPDETEVMP